MSYCLAPRLWHNLYFLGQGRFLHEVAQVCAMVRWHPAFEALEKTCIYSYDQFEPSGNSDESRFLICDEYHLLTQRYLRRGRYDEALAALAAQEKLLSAPANDQEDRLRSARYLVPIQLYEARLLRFLAKRSEALAKYKECINSGRKLDMSQVPEAERSSLKIVMSSAEAEFADTEKLVQAEKH